jgi:hypothetical protein
MTLKATTSTATAMSSQPTAGYRSVRDSTTMTIGTSMITAISSHVP